MVPGGARLSGGSRTVYLPVFDGFRGAAVLLIVLAHISVASGWIASSELLEALRRSLFLTPELFFVISGFALFLPVAARGGLGDIRDYAVRRAARIMPAYWVSLILTLVVANLLGRLELPPDGGKALLAHLFFVQHPLGISGLGGVNQVYWVLSILVLFYALLPLVASRYLRHPVAGLVLAIGAMLIWRLLVADGAGYLTFIQFPLFVADFAIGMSAAVLFTRLRRAGAPARLRAASVPVALLALLGLLAVMYAIGLMRIDGEIFFFGHPAALALAVPLLYAALVVASAFLPGWAQWPMSNRLARWTGTVSFGVFVYHLLILLLAYELLGFERDGTLTTTLAVAATVIPASLAAGWLSYVLVERPVRDWASAYSRRHRTPALSSEGSRRRAEERPRLDPSSGAARRPSADAAAAVATRSARS